MTSDYELFATIIERGSLSAAAKFLKISPPMASKRLAALETRLGVQLIQRTTRRMSLTQVGQVFYERVSAIVAAAREAETLVSGAARTPGGALRLSAPTSFGRLHVAPFLKQFLDLYPSISLDVDLTDGIADFFTDNIDVAIRIGTIPPKTFSSTRLAVNRRIICASPSYIKSHGAPATLKELRKHRLLAAQGQLPWRLQSSGGVVTLEAESFVRTNSSEVVRELAVAGAGIALRSTWDIADEVRAGRLVQLLPSVEGAKDVGIYSVRLQADIVHPNVRALIEFFENLWMPVPPWDR